MPSVTTDDRVLMVCLGEDENRFSPDWITAVHEVLDGIVDSAEPAAVVTYGRGKFYSNGLDLDWLLAHADAMPAYVADVEALLARFLTLPVPTVAVVNGHAFGAGAMLATAHDFRVMRSDRGYFCFPEVDIDIPFTEGMAALIQAKLTPAAAVASMTTGRRFGGPEALAAGLVDELAGEAELLTLAAERVRPLAGKTRDTLRQIKSVMFAPAVAALTSGAPR